MPRSCRGAGRAGRCRRPSRFRRQPARLSELRREGRGRDQRRGARLWHARSWATARRGSTDSRSSGGRSPRSTATAISATASLSRPTALIYLTRASGRNSTPAQDMRRQPRQDPPPDRRGQPAPGNPWAAQGGVAAQFWTMGHRNVLGLAFAPDGRLWETEMGPKGGDEINLIVAGRNYGWPKASNGSHYGGARHPRPPGRRRVRSRPRCGGTRRSRPAG